MRKITFTPEQKEMLIRLFPNTPNQQLMDLFGCKVDRLLREAKSLGLEKDPKYIYRQKVRGCVKAWEANKVDGKIVIPNRDKTWKKNFQLDPDRKRKAVEKGMETLRDLREMERTRVLLGMSQTTKFKLKVQPVAVANFKRRLRKAGYKIKPGTRIAFYDENTKRRDLFENMRRGDKGYVFFEYRPITEFNNV